MSVPQSQDSIRATDYNFLQSKVQQLLGTGSGSRGYGQTNLIQSSPQAQDVDITRAEWARLREEIRQLRLHQTGSAPGLIDVNSRLVVSADVNQVFNNELVLAENNRFQIANSRAIISTLGTQSRSGSWSVRTETEVSLVFNTAESARFFFNAGGRIRFSSQRSGVSNTPQNLAWTNFLNAIGIVDFRAAAPFLGNFYTLTNQYQTVYDFLISDVLPGSIYGSIYGSPNGMRYKISAKSNVSNNQNGTANQLTFRVEWLDDYVSSSANPQNPDLVSGTLSLTVTELKAAQPFFNIESPLGSISPFVAT